MSNALVPHGDNMVTTLDEIQTFASLFAKSGYFADSREMAQAAVRIIIGKELGLPPGVSMNGVYIIKGRTSLSANLMATLIKQSRTSDGSRRYDYRVVELTDQMCSIDFFECGEKLGNSTWTATDAKRAGTQNMDKFPRNMNFARALSNGVKWYCPDLGMGAPLYTPEELGATVNEDGEVIDVISRPVQPKPEAKPRAVEPKQEPEPAAQPQQEAKPPVDLPALRKQFIAAWKAANLKPKPALVAKILNLSEIVAADCFDDKNGLKIKDLSEDELNKLIRYAAQGSEEKPAEEDRNPFAEDEEGATA